MILITKLVMFATFKIKMRYQLSWKVKEICLKTFEKLIFIIFFEKWNEQTKILRSFKPLQSQIKSPLYMISLLKCECTICIILPCPYQLKVPSILQFAPNVRQLIQKKIPKYFFGLNESLSNMLGLLTIYPIISFIFL